MRSISLSLLATAVLTLAGCGPSRPPCGPSTCTGCCDTNGQCQLGSATSACGKSGVQCKACLVSETCNFGICEGTFTGTGGGFGGTGGGFSSGGGAGGGFGGGAAGGFGTGGGAGGGFSTGGGSAGGFGTGGGSAGGFGTGGGAAGGLATGGGVGGGSAVPGDTCATAIAMSPISATQFTATASLTGAADDSSATCGGAGPDLAFSFVVTTPSDVSFTITSIGGANTPVGYLRRDDCTTELRCHTGTSTSTAVNLQPGSYRLIVDALSSGASGTFTATVTLSTPGPLVGDDCGSAEVLTLSSGFASASGSTDGYNQTHSSASCGTTGADRFYRLTLSSSSNVTATVTPSSGGLAGVYLLGPTTIGTCASAPESGCGESTSLGGSATVTGTALSAGTWYVVVKNRGSPPGQFSLSVTTTPATVPGDSCATAVPLTFSAGSASANGTLSGASNDRSSSCATTNADVVYSFTATAGQVLTATATPGSSWRPVLTLTSGASCSSASETICGAATSAGGSATLTTSPLAAGTYYLWVDSVSGVGTPGSFTLSASLSAGGGNGDTCSGPIPLSFFGGTATETGTTSGLVNDNSSSCTGSSGPDRVYSFTATSGQTLTASLTPSGWQGHLVLRGPNGVCSSASEVSCQLGVSAGSIVSLTASSLTAGTYYLWVDGVSGSAGSYSLSATLSSGPAPTGESCTNPIPLTFASGLASASGSTATALHDRTSACGGGGPDRVYSFTVSGTRSFSATVSPTSSTLRPVIYITGPGSCSTSITETACLAATANGLSTTLPTQTLTTGTYFLWVDSWSGTSGTYSLSATLN